MSVGWFGDGWGGAPVASDPAERIQTPVGDVCIWCAENIAEDDTGLRYVSGQSAHAECNLRSVVGNVHHLKGECEYVGHCNDLSTKTYREQAREVWDYFPGSPA